MPHRSNRRSILAAVATCIVLTGCAGATARSGARAASAAPDRSVVAADELARARAATLLDALLQLRPDLARPSESRHAYSAVFVDGVRMGGAWALESIRPEHVALVRFVRGADAPVRTDEGAILVTLRFAGP